MRTTRRPDRIDADSPNLDAPGVIVGLPAKLYRCQCCLTVQPDADSEMFECWRCGRRNKHAKLIDTCPS